MFIMCSCFFLNPRGFLKMSVSNLAFVNNPVSVSQGTVDLFVSTQEGLLSWTFSLASSSRMEVKRPTNFLSTEYPN